MKGMMLAPMRRCKKGVFEAQFAWIFILIAGAVILAFFFMVISKQRSLSEQRVSATIIQTIDTVVQLASQAKNTIQPLEVPDAGIALGCTEECECTIKVGKISRGFRDSILFGPPMLKGETAAVWTKEFAAPFRAANLVYLTNPRTKYFLIYKNTNDEEGRQSKKLLEKLRRILPKEVFYEEVPIDLIGNVKNEGYTSARFVFLTNPCGTDTEIQNAGFISQNGTCEIFIGSFEQAYVGGLEIHSDGKLIFHKRVGKKVETLVKKESTYLDDATLLAAFFSSDEPMYRCGVVRAMERLVNVGTVYHNRTDALMNDTRLVLDREEACAYNTEPLTSLLNKARKIVMEGSLESLSSLATISSTLDVENRRLLRTSCPEIY